jgi:hypothetical protein
MREYARQRGLRRWIIRVPFLSLSLSSRWLTLITPVYARIGKALIESVRNPSVVKDSAALSAFAIRPMSLGRAIQRALANEDREFAETRWSDALSSSGHRTKAAHAPGNLVPANLIIDEHSVRVVLAPPQAFRPIQRIGGENGWYYGNLLWRIRGLIDLMSGGVGMRRGRRDPETPLPGSTLDFWRVEKYEPGRRLRLAAEMKLPGRAWLEFRALPEDGATVLTQIAEFEPRGLFGLLYWYGLYPIHQLIFRGMLRRIAASALREANQSPVWREPHTSPV